MFSQTASRFLTVILLASPLLAGPIANETSRRGRLFSNGKLGIDLAFSHCGITFLRCPANCAVDPVFIHGYCCECPGVYEFLPVHCPIDLICPPYPEELCPEFDYLLDCCC